ncbi:TolC family protein [Marinilabilia salmonicolor]|jgi:NodT family efflux transporter outer membrane factor (OMF) lipoprotein|uniref:NodT family efflux transporter outer membrane factor (OMF) lipoprotein n=1 Tax=Marinilabilia salmonicolor TaxID=989 RepID=A0A2T0XNX1_9BACT|nr:TolC family protein [Marinilabilia salmonicolor]PRZ00624.1 NodT family efflux transporter outer membrane factor (OMF) lipoprotein [Marinilabilia salmonicolor]RCW30862.1 NodT family efflux transporter outer membrane factor (OMF) lipoprotein [Marinilabilia salmonicolor]
MEHTRYFTILIVFLLLFTGCSPKTSEVLLPDDALVEFSQSGEIEISDNWWEAFKDQQLNDLVDSALNANYDVQTAWYRLREAEAIARQARSSFFPQVDGSGRGQVIDTDVSGQSEVYELGLSAGYELDLWGKVRSEARAQSYRQQASFYDFQATALLLSAQVVKGWFDLLEARQQVALARDQRQTNEKMLELLQTRFQNGLGNLADVLRQQQLMESTREQEIVAETRLQIIHNRLSVLLGKQPQKQDVMDLDHLVFPDLPPLPKTGMPAELIRRRPDIQRSMALLKASDQDLASSISNLFPRISISASLSTESPNAEDLFDDWVRSLAGSVLAPVFYGNRLQAEKDQAEAVRNQRIYEYGQTVLSAFQDVEDALVEEKQQQRRLQSIEKQYELAQSATEQVRSSYFNGVGNYLDVLDAMDTQQNLRRQYLSETLTLLKYRIDLYQALAGGFDTDFSVEE